MSRVASLTGAPGLSVVVAIGAIALLLLAVAPSALASIRFAQKWGSQGSGEGQLQAPQGIATGSAGNVYVSDSTQIKRFSSSGAFLGSWGSEGTGDGQLNGAGAIATDPSGHVYVADLGNGRIEKFSSSGAFLGQWGSPGSGDGQFTDVGGIATDPAGNVFVSDVSENRIQEFDPFGGLIAKWGTEGSGGGELSGPEGIAIDDSDNLYVVDYFNSRIERFSTVGTYLGQWGSQGSADGQFQSPLGIAADPAGNVYVADYTGNTIQKFDPSGEFLARWGTEGTGDGQFDGPIGIAVDASSNVYVVEAGNHRVQKFRFSASPPATAITGGPSGTTYQPSPTFRFSSPDLDTTFACRIDSRPYVPCGSGSPPSYTSPHLADGPHTFSVRAMDSAGKVDPTPATRSFTVRTASVDVYGSTLVVTAAPGAKDNLRFGWRLSDYPLTVTNFPRSPGYGSGLDAGAGCTQSGQYMALCGFGVTRIRVRAGDRNDLVTNATGIPNRNNTGPIPSTFNGEAGADTLTGGPLRDTLIGGPGADVMRGMGANDQLDARDLTSDRWIDCDGASNPGPGDVATLDLLPKDGNFIVKGCEFKRRGR